MKKRNILLSAKVAASALAVGAVLTATVGSAWAYFTTYTSAAGGYAIELSNETHIQEDFSNETKRLVVTNEGTQPVYVRARAFSAFDLEYSDEENLWERNGDYYYYTRALDGIRETEEDGGIMVTKDSTSELRIKITFPDSAETDNFNVVVIYESAPVQYDADGNAYEPWDVDWTQKVVEGGVE